MIKINHLGHMVVGLLVGGIAMLALNVFSPQLIAIILLGSILPDIDLKQSKASRIVFPIAVLGLSVLLQPIFLQFLSLIISWLAAIILSSVAVFVILLPLRKKHRGITHSPFAAVAYGIAALLFGGVIYGVVGALAYASHLIADFV